MYGSGWAYRAMSAEGARENSAPKGRHMPKVRQELNPERATDISAEGATGIEP